MFAPRRFEPVDNTRFLAIRAPLMAKMMAGKTNGLSSVSEPSSSAENALCRARDGQVDGQAVAALGIDDLVKLCSATDAIQTLAVSPLPVSQDQCD